MSSDLTLILILAATVATGLLAGASLDKAIVQLPARHRMGVIGFARFSRANDLGNGLLVYPVFGIAAALLTLSAALTASRGDYTRAGLAALSCRALGSLTLVHNDTRRPHYAEPAPANRQ